MKLSLLASFFFFFFSFLKCYPFLIKNLSQVTQRKINFLSGYQLQMSFSIWTSYENLFQAPLGASAVSSSKRFLAEHMIQPYLVWQ